MEKEKMLIKEALISIDLKEIAYKKFHKEYKIWVYSYDGNGTKRKSNFLGSVNLN